MPRISVANHPELSPGMLRIVASQVDLFERIERNRRFVPIDSQLFVKETPVGVEPALFSLPLGLSTR